TITSKKSLTLPKYKIITDKGDTIVSVNHEFLTRTPSGKLPGYRFAQDLKEGYQIFFFESPWDSCKTLEKEYLAGFLDGEGCYSNGYLSWAQNPGVVSQKVLSSMETLGFTNNQRYTKNSNGCETFRIYGGYRKSIRAVGEIRPARLLEKAIADLQDKQVASHLDSFARVISVESLGEGEVIALETTSKTYINDGFFSHNCDEKFRCWPNLSKYIYSSGPRYLSVVEREPKVFKE
ncbi:hypothetical protein, partial [Parabacteroides distasonis]|uniref:hypothetical protein n=1 Tax=Parabacteroides distasonis TaxID=823 RepID=UPI001567B297